MAGHDPFSWLFDNSVSSVCEAKRGDRIVVDCDSVGRQTIKKASMFWLNCHSGNAIEIFPTINSINLGSLWSSAANKPASQPASRQVATGLLRRRHVGNQLPISQSINIIYITHDWSFFLRLLSSVQPTAVANLPVAAIRLCIYIRVHDVAYIHVWKSTYL